MSAPASQELLAAELVPLGVLEARLAEPTVLSDTPVGTRVIFEVVEARFEGERLRAESRGRAGADWLVIGPDGTGMLDVRFCLETHDGAFVFVQYNGRSDVREGLGAPAYYPIYTAPRFETGDARYAWLNCVQAVAKGRLEGLDIVYQVYEVR